MNNSEYEELGAEDLERLNTPDGIVYVGLDSLDPKEDAAEIQEAIATDPASDSPGDDALLKQEELYEGLSSERKPSAKVKRAE